MKINNLVCQKQNDAQFEAYKPIFTIQTVFSSVIGNDRKHK